MAVAYELNSEVFQGRLGTGVDFHSSRSGVSERVRKGIDEESLVITNTQLTRADRVRIGSRVDQAWGDALDNANNYYTQATRRYYGIDWLDRLKKGIGYLVSPHEVEITVPDYSKIRKWLTTGIL